MPLIVISASQTSDQDLISRLITDVRLKSALARVVTDTISKALDVPTENIWIHYEEMNPHDVWFNNQWS